MSLSNKTKIKNITDEQLMDYALMSPMTKNCMLIESFLRATRTVKAIQKYIANYQSTQDWCIG